MPIPNNPELSAPLRRSLTGSCKAARAQEACIARRSSRPLRFPDALQRLPRGVAQRERPAARCPAARAKVFATIDRDLSSPGRTFPRHAGPGCSVGPATGTAPAGQPSTVQGSCPPDVRRLARVDPAGGNGRGARSAGRFRRHLSTGPGRGGGPRGADGAGRERLPRGAALLRTVSEGRRLAGRLPPAGRHAPADLQAEAEATPRRRQAQPLPPNGFRRHLAQKAFCHLMQCRPSRRTREQRHLRPRGKRLHSG